MTSMKRYVWGVALFVIVAVGRCQGVVAQAPAEPGQVERVQVPSPEPAVEAPRQDYSRGQVLRVGQDYRLLPGESVREVAVFFGDAVIEGHVGQMVLVVFGRAHLASTASVDGGLAVFGGSATAEQGAAINGDLVVVGGTFDAPPGFSPGGNHVVVGPAMLAGRLGKFVPWLTYGLLLGRPIVPSLPWVWAVVGVFFLVYLALDLVFDSPVRDAATTLAARPVTAFLVGLLVLLLTGPICLLLALSVIGIVVIPFVIGALVVAAILGKVAVARWIGMRIVPENPEDGRLPSVRSFALGFAVISIAYMIPILGFLAWTTLGVLGLGGMALSFVAGYRRENPLPFRRTRTSPAPVVPPAGPIAENGGSVPSVSTEGAGPGAWPAAVPSPQLAPPTSDLTAYPRASFFERVGAFALDAVLTLIVLQLFDPTRQTGEGFLFLLVAYHAGFWTWKGTTVGGIICQLRVVRMDGAPLRFVDALVRALSAIFSVAVVGIGALWMLRDPERQMWHDRIAGTYVVKVPRNYPI